MSVGISVEISGGVSANDPSDPGPPRFIKIAPHVTPSSIRIAAFLLRAVVVLLHIIVESYHRIITVRAAVAVASPSAENSLDMHLLEHPAARAHWRVIPHERRAEYGRLSRCGSLSPAQGSDARSRGA